MFPMMKQKQSVVIIQYNDRRQLPTSIFMIIFFINYIAIYILTYIYVCMVGQLHHAFLCDIIVVSV